MAKSKIELQEEAKKLNIELTGEETPVELKELIKKASSSKSGDNQTGQKKPSAKLFIWLKARAYINDSGIRMDGGFFQVESLQEYPRLELMPKNTVEVFNEVPSAMKLAQIAKWLGIDPDNYKEKEDMLAVMISTPTFRKGNKR